MIVREATAEDWPAVYALFLEAPLSSGTTFVLDRRPDFGALPASRGRFRTLLAFEGPRLAGTATALWRPGRDGAGSVTVGELIDLRVAPWARGGRAALALLRAVHETFRAAQVEWVLCLIGRDNAATVPLVAQRAGLPRLEPLEDYASVHFIAARLPAWPTRSGIRVRPAGAADAALLEALEGDAHGDERFAPPEPLLWPDPTRQHRAWLAFGADGAACGGLVAWDSEPLRRLRILRYRAQDLPLRIAARVAAVLGIANPLPAPAAAFGLWATRTVEVRSAQRGTFRALVRAALGAAAAAGQSALQVNLRARDPLLGHLPALPRSVFRSTLYGGRCDGGPLPPAAAGARYYADIARV